jgi:hypothetical protein
LGLGCGSSAKQGGSAYAGSHTQCAAHEGASAYRSSIRYLFFCHGELRFYSLLADGWNGLKGSKSITPELKENWL